MQDIRLVFENVEIREYKDLQDLSRQFQFGIYSVWQLNNIKT